MKPGSVRETLALRAIGRVVAGAADHHLRNAPSNIVIATSDKQVGAAFVWLATQAASAGLPPLADRYYHWRGVLITFACGSPFGQPEPENASYLEFVDGFQLRMRAGNNELEVPLRQDRIDDPTYLLQTIEHEMNRAIRFLGPTASAVAQPPTDAAGVLRDRWAFLSCHKVDTASGRDPDDVFEIELHKPTGRRHADGTPIYLGKDPDAPTYQRIADIPPTDRDRARVFWHNYRGRTTDGVEFEQRTSAALDIIFEATLDWSTSVHTALELPLPGQWLCGELNHDTGSRMRHWFPCGPEFKLLLDLLRSATPVPPEDELGRLLLTDGYPDLLWAIGRLVFFNNVQAFVDATAVGNPSPTVSQLFMGEPRPSRRAPHASVKHPAHGLPYGRYRRQVEWEGMILGIEPARFVHEMSLLLDQPQWWHEFLKLADQQNIPHSHPGPGGICSACIAADPDWHTNGFPYQNPSAARSPS